MLKTKKIQPTYKYIGDFNFFIDLLNLRENQNSNHIEMLLDHILHDHRLMRMRNTVGLSVANKDLRM